MEKKLSVYLNENFVGVLTQQQKGLLIFCYDSEYLNKKNIPISISLPLRKEKFEGDEVKAYFSGLLPDESIRQRLAQSLGLSYENAFALLEVVGGECAGAVSLLPYSEMQNVQEKEETDNESLIEELNNERLFEILNKIKGHPFLVNDENMRLSLAGAQDKLAIRYENKKILLAKGSNPTTHILKPPIERVNDSVYNEFFCMQLAKKIGLDVSNSCIHFANGKPFYIVERYDRIKQENGSVIRLHQEDFCQAMGLRPEIKYQREGGPSIIQCKGIIEKNSSIPALDIFKFVKIVIFNFIIGNSDAHGKNFSFLYKKNINRVLAPSYDILSTQIYDDLTPNMAMKIDKYYDPNVIYLRHWLRLADQINMKHVAMEKELSSLSRTIKEKSDELILDLKEKGISSCVFEEINKIIKKRSNQIKGYL